MSNNTKNQIIALSPGDVIIQIVPEFVSQNTVNTTKSIPTMDTGYIIPFKSFLTDEYQEVTESNNTKSVKPIFCGIFDISTIFFNDSIRRDILDELYRDNVTFDIYIRQRPSENLIGPSIIKEYNDCYLYRQELSIPEVGLTTLFRYHFTNSNDPWEIPATRMAELKPPNQYIYDYAVSKAIKNLQYPINDVCKALNNISERPETKIVTTQEYIELVKNNSE